MYTFSRPLLLLELDPAPFPPASCRLAVFYDGTCGALGSITLANLLPSYIYQLSAHGNVCSGGVCFGPTHAIIAVLCTFGCCAAAVVSARSRSLYKQIAAGAATMALL